MRFTEERGRCSISNCDSLCNNGAVRLSGRDGLCNNHRLGFVENGNVGNDLGDAADIDSLSDVEDLNREAGDLRRQSRLNSSSRRGGNCRDVLRSDGGYLDIDSPVDSGGNDNVVHKCSGNDSDGDSEISIDGDCSRLSDNLNH